MFMANVILINPFEVTLGREDDCSAQWEKVHSYLKKQPGYISMHLYKAISSDARFRFISIAEWKSVDHYQAARESEEFRALTSGFQKTFPHFPAFYEVVG